MRKWHYLLNEQQIGPVTEAQLISWINNRQLPADVLVWSEGLDTWYPAHQFEELRSSKQPISPPPVPAVPAAAVAPDPVPIAPSASPSADAVRVDDVSSSLKGVKGWLLFFCVSLVFLSPIYNIYRIATSLSGIDIIMRRYPTLGYAVILELIVGVGVLIFGLIAGINLWSVKPGAVKLAKIMLRVNLWASIAVEILIIVICSGLPSRVMDAITPFVARAIASTLVYYGIWFTYLKKSKRVRATYGEN